MRLCTQETLTKLTRSTTDPLGCLDSGSALAYPSSFLFHYLKDSFNVLLFIYFSVSGNLRDHLLEIEERIWVGGIGATKCDDRVKWRTQIEEGMIKLIKYDKNTGKLKTEEPKTEEQNTTEGATSDSATTTTTATTTTDNTIEKTPNDVTMSPGNGLKSEKS